MEVDGCWKQQFGAIFLPQQELHTMKRDQLQLNVLNDDLCLELLRCQVHAHTYTVHAIGAHEHLSPS